MTGVGAVVGTAVRDREGRTGRIATADVLALTLAWSVPGSLQPRTESLNRSDARLGAIDALTLDRGWVSLRSLAGARHVAEASPHSPFQKKSSLGPGPKGREIEQQNRYTCTQVGRGKQSCIDRSKGGVRRKTVQLRTNMARQKKKDYQRGYRKWKRGEEE